MFCLALSDFLMANIFVNPFTDFGFKRLFGEEPHKELLISFLNTLLPAKHQIQNLHYTKNEYQGFSALDRKAIFDLNCISTTGERFIVELQKAKQNCINSGGVIQDHFIDEKDFFQEAGKTRTG